jgi:Na+/H+-dicarboxylate symporter
MFDLEIPKIISNDITLVAGVLLGLILVICKNGLAIRLAQKFDTFTKLFFKGLTPIMPLFIAGMTMKLQHDGILKSICEQYLPILFIFVISAFGWIFLQFFVFSGFRFSKFSEYIKNTLPAMLTALGSMSSAVALPLSIKAAEKNLIEKRNAGIIAPSVVNIHLVGDCFFIPMIALTVMVSFGMKFPTMREYILFTLHFVITKFAVAAVPGGGVIVMIPVMQNYLGLSVEMTALVTALYILFDPLITTCNVFGNASLSIIFDKITRLWKPAAQPKSLT